ncbi:flagellar motor stator protein MotA [Vibrio furnissii]|uniref:Flagellar motor stator protein MotA n=1 Tax=Vibrio furnissii TaxID=29494 RepID=A0A0Q2MD05_VIBFU|nr:flagellar motor stator protein MotA [Vibrio furnissii]KQH85602.1 flagellar motor stator protein MotA [Vibrio furnissii]
MKQVVSFVVILIIIAVSFVLHGGRLGALISVAEIAIIFGCAICGMIIASKTATLKLMLQQVKISLSKSTYDRQYYQDLLSLMFELINVAKMQNLKALDAHVENPESSNIFAKYPSITRDENTLKFIVDSFRQIISSKMSAHDVEAALEEEIEKLLEEYKKPSEKMHAMAEAMPGIGILAAVMGIILTMQYLDAEVSVIGQSIAGALVGTFTGIFGCYCLFGPLSQAIQEVAEEQIAPLQCVRCIISAYCQNLSPHMCVNAGRRQIELHHKPTFTELEQVIDSLRS